MCALNPKYYTETCGSCPTCDLVQRNCSKTVSDLHNSRHCNDPFYESLVLEPKCRTAKEGAEDNNHWNLRLDSAGAPNLCSFPMNCNRPYKSDIVFPHLDHLVLFYIFILSSCSNIVLCLIILILSCPLSCGV